MEQLLNIALIKVGDEIVFQFKKHRILGTVGYGGHVANTTIIDSAGNANTTLKKMTYPSLTAWSEACLREGLREENTRYASWKRVIHMRTGRTLQSLRSQLNVNTKMASASRQDLYSEINRLRMEISRLKSVAAVTTRTVETSDAVLVADELLMSTPTVIEFFKTWANTQSQLG